MFFGHPVEIVAQLFRLDLSSRMIMFRFLQVIHLQLDNVAGEVSPPGVSVHQQMLQHHPLILPHAGRLSSAPLSQRVRSVERTCSGGTKG